jgi:hypothetical protein
MRDFRTTRETARFLARHVLLVFGILSLGWFSAGCAGLVSAGNSAPATKGTIAVSMTAPTNGATLSGTFAVTAKATDSVGTVAGVQFQLDGVNVGSLITTVPYSYSWNTAKSSNGSHILKATAQDSAGNAATSTGVTVTVNNATGTTPPTVSITSPATGATVTGTVTVAATASDKVGVASVQFQLDGANLGSLLTAAPYSISWNTGASNGSHVLTAIAKDTAGNSATSAGVTVTVNNAKDTTPPTVSITSPATGATVSGTITVTATASDKVGVASVQFQLDGANLGSLLTAAPYSVSWNTAGASNGSHILTAIAKDTAGNSATSAGVTVTVNNAADTTPPSVPTGLKATAASSSQINLSWNASTDNVGVAGYKIYRGGSQIGTSAATSYGNTGLSASTSYTYTVAAYDAAGNTSAQSASASATTLAAGGGGGGTITSFQLSTPLTGTFPFTVGQGFKDGDIPSGTIPALSISPSQCVITKTWNDGSAKLAVCSGTVPLVANTPYTVSVSAGQSQGGTAMTCANITAAAPSASVQLGSIGTVTLSSLLSSPFRTWISGPEMVECDYLKPEGSIGSDANLQVWFNVRLYSTGQVWVQVVVENPGMDVATVDKNYIPTVTIGGTVVYNNGGNSLDHAAYSRWVEEGWIGTNPQITPQHNTAYLEASKLVPNYLNLTPPSSPLCGGCPSLSTETQTYTPMSLGDGDPNESDTGYQTQIGLLPLWDALFITSGADPRAYNAMIANAKAQNTFPVVWNVSTTHLTPRPSDWLTWSIPGPTGNGPPAGAAGAGTTDVSNTYAEWDVAHHPSAGYLAYIVTGQHFYLEEMANESAMCYLVNSSSHGSGDNRTIAPGTVQDRGQAWCFRTMMQYTAIAPSGDTIASDYASLLSNSIAYLNTVASTASPIGYVLNWDVNENNGTTDGALAYQTIYDWEEEFMEMAIGMGTDVQPLSSMTAWQQLETFVMQVPVGKLGPGTTGQSGYPFTRAAQHHFIVTATPSGSPATYFSTWQSVLQNNETGGLGNPPVLTSTVGWTGNISGDANTLQCGVESNPPNDNCSSTDPANAAGGYWGNLLPTIAYAVNHNISGAAAAGARLTGATNYSTMINSTTNVYGGFASTPTWGIVPISASSTPPPTTSVSVTSPSSGATVSGTTTVAASASSTAGVAGVQIQLDGANVGSQLATAPYSLSWNTTSAANGVHSLTAVVQDGLGNLTTSAAVSVTVSNASTGPAITSIASFPSSNTAVITWVTSEAATSQVQYGTTTSYGSQTILESTFLTTHSVILSALSVSTTYQFQVLSTDASGNMASSVNYSFTTTAQAGGGIPSSLGWYQIPSTNLRPLCPPYPEIQAVEGCSAVMADWAGALFDTSRNALVITGGGHNGYYGNEIYSINLNANPITVTLLKDATHNPNLPTDLPSCGIGNPCPPSYLDGTPSSLHNYSGLVYLPTQDLYVTSGGFVAGAGGDATDLTWTFNPKNANWTQSAVSPVIDAYGSVPMLAYDPGTDSVFQLANRALTFWQYQPAAQTWTQLSSSISTVCQSGGITAAIDPIRRIYICIGGGAFSKISLNSPYTASNLQGTGCGNLVSTAAPGFVYYPVQQAFVGWAGGNTYYIYNPDTDSCTTGTYPGGPTTIQTNGTYGRFQYSAASGVFIVVNDVDSDAYTLKLN